MDDQQANLPTQEEITDALTAQEQPELALFTTPEEREIALRLLPILQVKALAKARETAEAEKAAQVKEIIDGLVSENEKMIKAKIAELEKALKPPTPEELQTLLNQEYVEFKLQLRVSGRHMEFTIRELPMAAETRIITAIRRTVAERLKELALINWEAAAANSLGERVVKIMELVPGTVETLADCVAIILDPCNLDKAVNGDWVLNNLSAVRMGHIIQAQLEVGRYRDFLSQVFPYIRRMTMS